MKKIIICLLLFGTITAQEKDPYKILEGVKEKFNTIQDYEVDATIKVDVNFLRVPESHAKVYFKQPDKVKLDSKGFALLPKEGLNFSPTKLLSEDFNAIYTKTDTLNNNIVDVIKVIPLSDSSNIILTTLWIDEKVDILHKIETTTKRNGTFEINLLYDNTSYQYLPSQVRLVFSVTEVQIPKSISGEFNNDEEPMGRKQRKRGPMTGTVIIQYENYKVNQGLDDSLFYKEKGD